VLSNTTIGVLLVSINQSILLISLPDIFRGIHLDPLEQGNASYLLWMILGNMIITAVLVVNLGTLGDIFGRVRMYNLGFALFTVFSVLLTITWQSGTDAAIWLIVMRILQGAGGALLFATSTAILTDALPPQRRGFAIGSNSVAAIAGSFVGLLLGGLLSPLDWRFVFFVSVPVGLFGTVWAYRTLIETRPARRARIDWWGNVTFAVGLILVMVGITYSIQPYHGHSMSWTNPWVEAALIGGVGLLGLFAWIEGRVAEPMFHLDLFRIRSFTAANIASAFSAVGRSGLQFLLIIWLQGIWLPEHGYDFTKTPFWAAIYMAPLIIGLFIAGPLSGLLTDRYGPRPFATSGMLLSAATFGCMMLLPVDFSYTSLAVILCLQGFGQGLFGSPNRTGVMNSLPAADRGVGAGMNSTFQFSAGVLAIGIFFSLMIAGLASSLTGAMHSGLVAHGVPAGDAARISHLPPVTTLFASFLGYNPMATLLGPHTLASLPPGQAETLTGRSFFPHLIAGPFHTALMLSFGFALVCCLIAAVASFLRGENYRHAEEGSDVRRLPVPAPVEA